MFKPHAVAIMYLQNLQQKRNTQCFFLTVKIAHNQKEGTLYWLSGRAAASLQVKHHHSSVYCRQLLILEHSDGEGESYEKKKKKT